MSEKIKLGRYRNTSYFVRCEIGGTERQYTWTGAKGNRIDIKDIPKEVVDYLTMNSQCFDKGELVFVDDDEVTKEVKDGIADKETYEKNTHKREDIEKILKGNFMKMKSALNNITVDSEKQFVLEVAQDMQNDLTKGKIDAITEWMGVADSSMIFD